MAIEIKSKWLKQDVVDETGKVITTIKFNPDDIKTYTRFSNIVQNLYKAKDMINKNKSEIKDLPTNRDLNLEELDEYRTTFEKINETLTYQEERLKEIFDDFDYVFGEGTCDAIMQGTYDISQIMPIIEYATPYFNKSRKTSINRYLPEKEIEQLDVMD